MRLILVHGIHQEGKSEDAIKKEWLDFLEAGLGTPGATQNLQVSAPFYGNCLATAASLKAAGVIAQGADGKPDTEEATFLAAGLNEQAQVAGIGARAIAAEERALSQEPGALVAAQGFPMDRRLNAILRVIEKVSPMHGDLCLHLLKQAYAYLKRPGIGELVDAIVRPVLDTGPAVVVGHSLGTVVTFKLLRMLALEKRSIRVPIYVTLGSPLPLMAIQAALGPAFVIPKGVERWVNAVDPDDLIALGRGLDGSNFADGIENILDVRNVRNNPHSIHGYIGDKRIAEAIISACNA